MGRPFRLLTFLLMLAFAAIVGAYAYNIGVAHGIAESARAVAAAPGVAAPGVPVIPYWAYGPRPWGFGFVFFPFFGILLFLLVLRGMFWRSRWYGGGWGYGAACGHRGVPPMFDEWHRRAHGDDAPAPAPGVKS